MRATAILLVMLAHGSFWFLGAEALPMAGYLGVELFFVLSGFLIGGILLRNESAGWNAARLRTFWLRRWWRTLPAFWLVLVLSWAVDGGWWIKRIWFWNLTFLREFAWNGMEVPLGFVWSLCVEEWFYLLFPLLLAALPRRVAGVGRVPLAVAGVVAASVIGRYFTAGPGVDFDGDIRRRTVLKFDAIALGVGLAWIRVHANAVYRWLAELARGRWFAGGVVAAWALFAFALERMAGWEKTFSAWVPLGVDLMIAAALPWVERLPRPAGWIDAAVARIAAWSYALYLTHTLVYVACLHYLGGWIGRLPFLMLPVYVALAVGVAALMHRGFERPLLRWRERWAPG